MRRLVLVLIGAVSAACLFSPVAVARDGGLFSSLFDPTPSPTAEGRPRASAIPRELVSYQGRFPAGTIIISTTERRLYYVLGNGEFHTAALATLRHRSGFVLAHDVRLSGLYGFATNRKDAVPEGLSEIIKATYGPGLPDGLGASG